jgi:hypothetical protein
MFDFRKREEVLKQLQKHKECEEKAVKIVERLMEENLTDEFLKDAVSLAESAWNSS